MNNLSIGDRVRFSADWLQSIGCVSGTLPFARGTVTGFPYVGTHFVLARIQWDEEGIDGKVNVENLERVLASEG